MINITDPHLHLFNLAEGEYGWLQPNSAPYWPDKSKLLRDFGASDLFLSDGLSLSGYSHIEAGFNNSKSWLEVDWVESQAALPIKTVGCVDLCVSPDQFNQQLSELSKRTSLVGVRDIFDDQLDTILSSPNTLLNLRSLEQADLIFELQFDVTELDDVDKVFNLFKQFPALQVVLNHQGFGSSALPETESEMWLAGLKKLSGLANLKVKCSGFEMLDRSFTEKTLKQTIETVVSIFGESRVMVASNFPLITLSMSYSDYWSMVVRVLQEASLPIEKLVDLNAREIYRF
ncbi:MULTISPECIES: amidohydrolase [unclassified Marinobacterium]|uniref:amidohydrolase family protein n=1 Tax=unclassified Marinobacterium TaxID=2644139 RepID=UPI001569BBA6|nr:MULTISPECIES: amidohydrolase family protein [unclassified Marinobacterium]NRP09617.1 Amidohydrolase [Marinobacterium sp. xm-g-48]NRP58810.1 Amidohydrolase [Marinobacterium sp. xm-d-564]NRP81851.1 Amidohydrolase [Marinobacterium sp. xm-d-509]NRP95586.1 Amidohydrolase [Marinobacterium sp. xm-g-59]